MWAGRWRGEWAFATLLIGAGGGLLSLDRPLQAQAIAPRLTVVDPPGGTVGQSVMVRLSGAGMEGLRAVVADDDRIKAAPQPDGRFLLELPQNLSPGLYDLRGLGANGITGPRRFFVSNRPAVAERDSNQGQEVAVGTTVHGRIDAPGDVDIYRFRAIAGRRVVIEGWAERLDSRLRAVLELRDSQGRRIASSHAYYGLDPLIDFRPAVDGEYQVSVADLTLTGSPEHVYRIDIDDGPRPVLAWPNLIERGKRANLSIFGRNLSDRSSGQNEMDRILMEVHPPSNTFNDLRVLERVPRFAVEEWPLDLPGSPSPVIVGLTDVPVIMESGGNQRPESALLLEWPCEVVGRLEGGQETDWYRFHASRGEVIWLDLLGERIGAPVDLEVSILDTQGKRELFRITDQVDAPRIGLISLGHSDPSGRWVAPALGDYWLAVRNVIGGTGRDPRRVYRLSVRREEADFQLLAVPGGGVETGGWNVPRGGRGSIDVVALRRRGFSGAIRLSAIGLPDGYECQDVWIGPDVDRVSVIVGASREASLEPRGFSLVGRADLGTSVLERTARVATLISSAGPLPTARLTPRLVAATSPQANGLVTATVERTLVSQGSVVDVLVQIDPGPGWKVGPVTLTGLGGPADSTDHVSAEANDPSRVWLSFQVPERWTPGRYTIAVQAVATLTSIPEKEGAKPTTRTLSACSNPVTIEVGPGAIDLRIDPKAPRKIRRGEVVQLNYRAIRRNGFIGKIHTELHAPDGVSGIRGRGVTFVGQTDSGVIQIIASENAPIGRQPTLRLEAIGTVEDEPIHHVGCFFDLEILP